MPGSQAREQRDRRVLLALDLDHAHPAGAEAGQLRLVAQRRDLDPVVAADLEDRLALQALDDAAVDLDPDRAAATAVAAAPGSSSRRSACVSGSLGVPGGVSGGRSGRSSSASVGRGSGHRDGLTDAGRAGAAEEVVVELGSEVSHRAGQRERRQPLVVAQRRADDVGGEVRRRDRRRSGAAAQGDAVATSAMRRSRSGTGSSCRRPRRRRTGSAGAPGRRCRPGRRRRPRSPTRRARRPPGGVEVVGRLEQLRRQEPPDGPPTRTALSVRPPGRPAEREDTARAGCRAGPPRCRRRRAPGPGRGSCPARSADPIAANASRRCAGSRARRRGSGRSGRPSGLRKPARRRMRRSLLGLAALAVERLQQDGLLAEHVRALDRPDLDLSPAAPSTSSPMKPRAFAASIAASSRRIVSVASARTAMNASLGADREGRDARRPRSPRRGRVSSSVRSVLDGRVRAVAVRDDVARRAVRPGPPSATWSRSGSRRRRGRAGPRASPSRSSWPGRARRIARPERVECAGRGPPRRGRSGRSRPDPGRAPSASGPGS